MQYFFTRPHLIALRRQLRVTLATAVLLFMGAQYASGQAVVCPPNIDFTFGNLNNWYCFTGGSVPGVGSPVLSGLTYTGPIPATPGFIPAAATPPYWGTTQRHVVTSTTATDPYGGFPVVAPGGGLYSVRVGNDNTGAEAERIRYIVHVPVGFNNYSFAFKYAAVLNDGGHQDFDQPTFAITCYDSATPTVPLRCASPSYTISNGGSPGFSTSPTNNQVYYLGWTNGTLNLSGYGGKTIYVDVTSYDCTQGGHFGYGYFDVISCGQFNAAITFCNLSKGIVTLAAPGGYANYKWFKGPTIVGTAPIYNGPASATNIPTPTVPTYYYAVLTPYGSNGCPDTIRTRTISDFRIDAKPDTICNSLGKPLLLTVAATGGLGGFNYSWQSDPTLSPNPPTTTSLSGLLTTTNMGSAIARPQGSGYYFVTVTDSVGCFRQDTVIIQNPSFKLTVKDITTCLGTAVTLAPTLSPPGAGYIFKWSGDTTNLNNLTILNPRYTPVAIGTEKLILRVDSGVCAATDSFTVRTLPNFITTKDTDVCEGAKFAANVTGDPAFTYLWSPVLGVSNINIINPNITADTTRTYTITASYPTCPDIVDKITFRVEPNPIVNLGPDTVNKCFYTPVYLTARVTPTWFTNYTYSWKPNTDLDNLNSEQVTFTGIKDTMLYVRVTTPLGCRGFDSTFINVYAGKFGTVTPSDTAVCPRNPVTLTAGGGVSYLWQPSLYLNDTTSSTVTANLGASTTYTVYVKDKNGCVDTLPVALQVYSAALLSVPDSASIFPGTSYQMSPSGNALYFSWFPTAGLDNPGISNPVATPSVNTLYYVTGTTEAGCTAVDSIYILVNDETTLAMPNAFSPGSAPNPDFKVSHLGIATLKSFRIYNRWGLKIFETNDIDKGWNGQYNGEPQPMGVYIYSIEATTNKGKPFVKQGNVTLLR